MMPNAHLWMCTVRILGLECMHDAQAGCQEYIFAFLRDKKVSSDLEVVWVT